MKAPPIATGRLQLLRLFSTLLAIALKIPVPSEQTAQGCDIALLTFITPHHSDLLYIPRMKQRACVAILLIAISAGTALAQQTRNSASVAVPDEATAVKLAEKALTKIYGKRQIDSEKPFTANLADGIWHVAGTLRCKDQHGNVITDACVGGVAMADIRQNDGRVLKTGHTL